MEISSFFFISFVGSFSSLFMSSTFAGRSSGGVVVVGVWLLSQDNPKLFSLIVGVSNSVDMGLRTM